MSRVILHVDLDAFYASVEQRDNPTLQGKPLIIGADPKEGKGRGVVVSCSYEARRLGVRSGMPISLAYKLAPGAVYVRPNFTLYADVSSDIMGFLRKYADKFEQASIDEAYMDVSVICAKYGGPIPLATQIQTELRKTFGLTCSIGVAPNKSAAKIASDLQKPNGLTLIPNDQVQEFLAPLPVSKISGIGKKTEHRLNELGIRTIGELAKYSPKQLYQEFGKIAVWLWAIANAEERVEVEENYVMRSIGAEHTFETDEADWLVVDSELVALTNSVHGRLMDEGMVFRTVTLKIRFKGFETCTRSQSMKHPTTSKDLILEMVRRLSSEFNTNGKSVRLVGVRISGLEPKPVSTIDSFT
ncbi:MAG: DNA polymerase IV [Candidatus Bathyarchaeia archaeon]